MDTRAEENMDNDKHNYTISIKKIEYQDHGDRKRPYLAFNGRIERRETDIPDKWIKTFPSNKTDTIRDHCRSNNYEIDASENSFYYIMHIPLGICILQLGGHKYRKPVWEHSYFLVTKKVDNHFVEDIKQEIEPSTTISILHKNFLSYVRPRTDIEHKRAHMPERQFQCFLCDKSFYNLFSLSVHQQTHMVHHISAYSKPSVLFQCNYCEKYFDKQKTYWQHNKTHANDKIIECTYQCSYCDKSFTKTRYLIKHQKAHTGEKSNQCSKCDMHFTNKYSYLRHQALHSGNKPYHCINCDESFPQMSRLVYHQRIHTWEKPYQCKFCDKCFIRTISLDNHQRLHIEGKFPLL